MAPRRSPVPLAALKRHGTASGYRQGCGCPPCRDVYMAYCRRTYLKAKTEGRAPHGTPGCYVNYDCDRPECRQAWVASRRDYNKQYRTRQRTEKLAAAAARIRERTAMAEQQQGKHSPKPGSAKDVNARPTAGHGKHAAKPGEDSHVKTPKGGGKGK